MKDDFLEQWIREKASEHDTVAVKPIYIDINDGNLYDGTLFSQIMYWHGYSKKTGQPRRKVRREGHLWLAKKDEDWYAECRIKTSTARSCIKRMVKRGLLIKRRWKFNGAPTTHLRINPEVFEQRIKEHLVSAWSISDFTADDTSICHDISNPSGIRTQMHSPGNAKSLAKTTSEKTPENTNPASAKPGHDGNSVSEMTSDHGESTPALSEEPFEGEEGPGEPRAVTGLEKLIIEHTGGNRMSLRLREQLNEPARDRKKPDCSLPSPNALFESVKEYPVWVENEVIPWAKDKARVREAIVNAVCACYDWYERWITDGEEIDPLVAKGIPDEVKNYQPYIPDEDLPL